MFKQLFPYKTYLLILQLEGYDIVRWWRWWLNHRFGVRISGRQRLVRTHKLVSLVLLAVVWLVILGAWKWYVALVSLFFPGVLLTLAVISFWPIDWVSKKLVEQQLQETLSQRRKQGLRVIVISGSYGKTSVKEYLAHLLRQKYQVLRTPDNLNTVLGIAKVVEMELTEGYDFFVCELGAYRAGETRRLCELLQPEVAVLTGLNEQHLERFGSIQAEIEGESASVDYVLERQGVVFANMGNKLIHERYAGTKVIGYGEGQYVHPAAQNWEGAVRIAQHLGVSQKQITQAEATKPKLKNRLSESEQDGLVIIDDAYSSNTDGFRAGVDYLQRKRMWRVLVTPGIVELGAESEHIHTELGAYIRGKVDQVILVGKQARTEALAAGYGDTVEYVESIFDAAARVQKRPAAILYENDVTDNY